VTLDAARLGELRTRLTQWANERLSPEDLVPRLRIDAPLGLREISSEVIEGLNRIGPYGAANPKPVFRASPVDLIEAPPPPQGPPPRLARQTNGRAFRRWRGGRSTVKRID
jgi:hypothetical protein